MPIFYHIHSVLFSEQVNSKKISIHLGFAADERLKAIANYSAAIDRLAQTGEDDLNRRFVICIQ